MASLVPAAPAAPLPLEVARSCGGGVKSLAVAASAVAAPSGGGGRRICINDPEDVGPILIQSNVETDKDKSVLLTKIRASYEKACVRLLLRVKRKRDGTTTMASSSCEMASCFLNNGFCFGLLDPTSCIMANTLAAYYAGAGEEVIQDEDFELQLKNLEQRSLDGLVTFLICLFPYLDNWEAIHYLLLSGADLLVAARLVIQDRGITGKRFDFASNAANATSKTALKCAALAAKHARPDLLVEAWLTLSTRLKVAAALLSSRNTRSRSSEIRDLFQIKMPSPSLQMTAPWKLAVDRFRPTSVPYQHSNTLKRVLLDTIHSWYLKALALLPPGSRYHRSLLQAGHCYGPMDPVSNIIINTLWYDVEFPSSWNLEADMISTRSLLRIEARSFCGLLSFLLTRYQDLNVHEAMRCLIMADANLLLVDRNLDGAASNNDGEHLLYPHKVDNPDLYQALSKVNRTPCTSALEAFKAAATAAQHPNPDVQGELLSKPVLWHSAAKLLHADAQLSTENFYHLADLLSQKSHPVQQQSVPKYKLTRAMKNHVEDWMYENRRISKRVKDALDTYAQQNKGSLYELHVICGVNKEVSGPEYVPLHLHEDQVSFFKFHRTHVNFLATPKGGQHEGRALLLFFAELSNEDDDKGGSVPLCCPVSFPSNCSELVRCLYCEHEGTRIVHPAMEKFHGRESEFEKMVLNENVKRCGVDYDLHYTNRKILIESKFVVDCAHYLEDDPIYWDIDEDGREDSSCVEDDGYISW